MTILLKNLKMLLVMFYLSDRNTTKTGIGARITDYCNDTSGGLVLENYGRSSGWQSY